MAFDNMGTMRINCSTIAFADEALTTGDTVITVDEICFEGPAAPSGYVDAMRLDGIWFISCRYSANAAGNGLLMNHAPHHQRIASINGIPLNEINNDLFIRKNRKFFLKF